MDVVGIEEYRESAGRMNKIRVLIVEDSLTVRKRLAEIIKCHAEFELVGEAEDGKRGIELCQKFRPDVVTMDMMMPVMTGLAATEYIMAYCPTPIVIVSASTNRGDLFRTYEALAAGALDVLEKPDGAERNGHFELQLISAIKLASRVKVITHMRARLRVPRSAALSTQCVESGRGAAPRRVIAIGASTGGPAAVLEILKSLPHDFSLPILLAIHISEAFASSFADWLDGLSPLRVAFAKEGEALPAPGQGRVIMAPPGRHLMVSQNRLKLTHDPERHSCRPSVDVLFESVARECGASSAACLLTGMGKDGAHGLLEIKRAGGATFAQDEASSVVFGMPREAIALGAAERVLPLEEFAPTLIELAAVKNY